ncbi:hypothetical protein [Catellatospora sp. NPDC049609]|uniref:hypothetical protein n=1 Tax=Catellatospora sp. NPDC049609 TaxID=3155505 RepID=UPI00341FF0DF
MTWRTALGGLAGLVAAVAWALASARYMPIMQPTGFWLTDDGMSYPNIASNNTYWPREIRHLAILLAFAAVVLVVGWSGRVLAVGALASLGWLAADLALDRADVSGWSAVAALAAGAVLLTAATAALAGRLARGEQGSAVVRHVVAGTAALLAVACLVVVTPWDSPATPVEIRTEAELTAVKSVLAVLFAAIAAVVVGRPARNTALALGAAGVATVAGAIAVADDMGPLFGQVVPLAVIASMIAVAAPRVHGAFPLLGLTVLGVFAVFASVAVLFVFGMLVGGTMTELAGNPPVNGADSDIALGPAALGIGVALSLFSYLVTMRPAPQDAPVGPVPAGPAPADPASAR